MNVFLGGVGPLRNRHTEATAPTIGRVHFGREGGMGVGRGEVLSLSSSSSGIGMLA